MAEEFEESEVIFPDDNDNDNGNGNYLSNYRETAVFSKSSSRDIGGSGRVVRGSSNYKMKKSKKKKSSGPATDSSAPVSINIPDNVFQYVGDRDQIVEDHEYQLDGEIIPPHVIIGRRIAGEMAFSVCTGNGRTLKGRDLSQVRNSILRLTGFLET